MKHSLKASTSIFFNSLALAVSLSANAQPDQSFMMDKAPFHVPVFANDHIVMMNINIPPGRDTDFHTHYTDSVTVEIAPAIRTDQRYGSEEISAPSAGNPIPGNVSFSNVTDNGPFTHNASNVGPTTFEAIVFMLKNGASSNTEVSNRSPSAGYTQIMDNQRLRAWRVILEPGQTAGQITQSAPGLRVYVRGGVMDELVPGVANRGMAAKAGEFMWQEAGHTRSIRNTGATVLEFVEFEFK